MYVNVPNYESDQAITNRIKAATRHCRIGKVRMKAGVPWMDKGIAPRSPFMPRPLIPAWPHDGSNLPKPMFMGKCGCKVGTVCGNVACPHRLVATCSA